MNEIPATGSFHSTDSKKEKYYFIYHSKLVSYIYKTGGTFDICFPIFDVTVAGSDRMPNAESKNKNAPD